MKNEEYIKSSYQWKDLLAIVHKLRQPDGCPWDRAQTYETMTKCVLDEAEEVVEAVDEHDFINLREELGDLLLQVLLYSEVATEKEEFTLDDVINELACKLIRRHPHVFGDQTPAKDVADGNSRWNQIKLLEKQNKLKEYEEMYDQGRISEELFEKRKDQYNRRKNND